MEANDMEANDMGARALRGALMVCGTASDVGKSRLVAGLCRALARRGATVSPFKAQNMSLNSTVTRAGHEIARAQAFQAAAARTEPDILMGPVLLKPMGDGMSQLVVMGRPAREVRFGATWDPAELLEATVMPALDELRRRYDVVVAEGAGGAAEVNLLSSDIANLPLAKRAGLPALLVGDIEKGGVFASIFGTVALLPPELRAQLRGFVINKLRGYRELLAPGIAELERRLSLPCLGALPHLGPLPADEEDSLALATALEASTAPGAAALDIAIVRLPHLANFTDFAPLTLESDVSVRYVSHPVALGHPDLVVLPGSKATVADLSWLRVTGLDAAIRAAHLNGSSLLGVCGGYQMLGTDIFDDVESRAGHVEGLGYLEMSTCFQAEKTTRWRDGRSLSGETVSGYEIHHGQPVPQAKTAPWFWLESGQGLEAEGVPGATTGIWGTSLHGVLENDGLRASLLQQVAWHQGKTFTPSGLSFAAAREQMIDQLADAVEAHLDLGAIFGFAAEARPPTARPGPYPQTSPAQTSPALSAGL
jgi:adenosylcobyric acid synthase